MSQPEAVKRGLESQSQLSFPVEMASRPDLYRELNLAAARIILERPNKYRGALVDWARRVLAREAGGAE